MSAQKLPNNFKLIKKVDLVSEPNAVKFISACSLLVVVVMVVVGALLSNHSFNLLWHENLMTKITAFGCLVFGSIGYILIHEFIHGICIRFFSGKSAHYGHKSGCAYAGSDYYFGKVEYVIIALSPIIILGILIGICNVLIASTYFWIIYLIQILNISGGVGDLFVTYVISKMPKETLVCDKGTVMSFYAKRKGLAV